MSWIVRTPLANSAGFVYRLTLNNGVAVRHYIGRKRWDLGWEAYYGGGLLPVAWRDMFGDATITREICSVHATIAELDDAERAMLSSVDAVNSDGYLNLMMPRWDAAGNPVWNCPRVRDDKVLRQFASWFPAKRRTDKWRIVASTVSGLQGFKDLSTAAARLSMNASTVSNIASGRHGTRSSTVRLIRYLPTRAIPHVPNLAWID